MDSQTTQQAVTEEAGVQPTNRADNSYLDSYYSKRDETAGRTGTTVTPGSVKIDQSVFNDKGADSTVKNTLLSYYSKRQFENTPIEAAPMSTVKPTRVDNTIIGTAKTYGGALGGGLTAINKYAADRLNDTSDNVKGVGITDYAVNYYKDKDDEWLRKNLNPATYKAVTNAMRTNADMRKQALDQRNATDALQLAGQENLRQAKEGTNKIGETAVNVGSNVMEMSADRAITAALTAVGVPAKISQYTPLYLRSLGASNLEARQDGATENQAFVYGNLAASLEVATETMLSPTNFAEAAYGKGWLGSGIGKSALSTFSRKVAKSPIGQSLIYAVGNLGLAGIEESGEEAVSGVLTPLIKRITYDKDAKLDPKEVGESMLTAFIATVLTGGAGVANTSKAASVYNNPTTVNSLIEIAKTTQDEKTKAAKLATNLEKVVQDGGKPNNLEVVDLIHYLNESGSEAQTNKLYELADVDKSDSNAKAQLNGAVSLAMMNVNTAMTDASNMSESSMSSIDNEVNILANALVSEDVSDALKPSIAYTLQSFNTTRTTSNESGPVGIRRGDTVSYHVSQGVNETAPAGIEGYDVVRKHDNGTVDYIWTDDFNGNQFPQITRQVTVNSKGKQTDTTPKTATIINDKSTLVAPTYTGFDVNQQKINENFWKEGRKRTGLSYNTTQMNNKAYFDRYWDSLMSYENRAQNTQEVNNNVGTESSSEAPERNNEVPAAEQGVRGGGDSYIDRAAAELNFRRNYRRSRGLDESRLDQVESVLSELRENGAKEVTAKKFAGKIGGSENATVIPVTGKAAKQFAALTKELKKAGFKTIKYYAGPLTLEQNGKQITVNGVFDGDTVFVQVDDYQFTPEQIAKHENLHRMIRNNPNLFKAIEDRVVARYGQAQLDRMVADYTEGYNDPSMSQRDIEEEIFCDAYGNMDVLSSDGSSYFGASIFNEAVNEAAEITTESVETVEQAEAGTPQPVESTEVEAPVEHTEESQEITTEDVNAEAPTAETTEESVNTEPIRIKRSRDAEWEDVSRDDAISYGRELYGNLGNIKDPSRRLQMVNNTIQGYALTAEDVGGIESVDRDAKGAKVDAQTNAAIEKAAASDANQEIWDEPNAKLIFSGKAKSPDAYKFEVVEEKPNGTVTHTFFDTEDKATAHAEGRNQKNKTGAAIVVNLDESGALDRAVDESSKANMEAFEEDERRAPKYSRGFAERNGLNPYSDRQIDNWKNSKRIVVALSESDVRRFVEDSINDKIRDKTLYFGSIKEEIANKIKQETGLDVSGYNCAIGANEIKKTLIRSHGNESDEANRGQRVVTIDDIVNIPVAINNADEILLSENDYRGANVIEFRHFIDNERTVVISVVSSGRHELRVQTEYINIKRSLANRTDEQTPVYTPEAGNGTASTNNITDATENVNNGVKFSRSFDSAGRNLTEDQAEYFKDSKVRDDDGNLMPVYHGTDADFNIFDTSVNGGKNGTAEGFGIYLTNDEEVSKHYGGRIIEGYANITRPATSWQKTIKQPELAKLIQKTCEMEADRMAANDGYDDRAQALRDTWISNYVYTPEYSTINGAYNAVAREILKANDNDMDIIREVIVGQGIRDYEGAMQFYNEALTPTTGIDGFWTKWSDAEGNETADVMLAFNSNQVKNLDNLTPTTNPDIRFSRKLAEDGTQLEIADFLMQTQNMDEDVANENATQISSLGSIVVKDSTFGEKAIGKTLAVGFKEDLIKDGRTSLIGKTVESADDLATIAQVFRNPRFETFRMFFVNDNGEVVYQTGVASGLVSQTSVLGANPYSFLTKLARDAKRVGAVAYYGLHNHPSGNPEPSAEDYRAGSMLSTFFNERNIIRKGDVIINSNKYAVYDSVYGTVDIKPLNENIKDELLTPVGDTGLIRTISGPDDLANLGKAIQLSPGFSGVIYLNAKMKTTAVQEISNKFLSDEVKLSEFIEENLTKYGALNVAFVTDDRATFEAIRKIWKSGLGVDVILLEDGQLAISANTVDKQNSGMLQKHSELEVDEKSVFDNSVLRFSRNFASTEEMNRAYSEAVKSNPEEAQKMLDSFAEEKGYTPYALYHGTDKYGFTEFDLGQMDDGRSIFMTDEKEVARSYSNSEYVGTPKPLVTDDLRGLVDEYIAQNPRDKVTVISPDGLEKEYAKIIDNAHKEIAKNKESFENDVERYGWAEDDNDRLEAISAAYEKGLNAETREELDEARDDFMDVFGDFVPEYFDITDHLSQLSNVDVAMEYGEPVAYIKYDGYGYGEYMTADDLLQLLGSNDNASGNLKLYAKTDNPFIFDANLDGWDTMKFDPLGVAKKMGEIQTIAWKELGLAIDPKEVNNLYKTGEISDGIEAAMQNDSIKQLVNEVGDASVEYQRYNIDPFNHTTRTREVSAYAKGNGYDSVIFKNLYDIGRYGGTHRHSTIYILFNPSQAKSADLVTYYGDGTSIPLSQRFDTTQTDIRFSRNFGDLNTYIAKAENEYIRDCVTNFNSSKDAKKNLSKVNPVAVAQQVKSRYNSTVDTTLLQKAVDELKQYAADKVSTGNDVNYVDAKVIANAVAREVILKNKTLTDTDGYKTYEKMVKFVGEMPIKISGGVSRYIDNYQGWKTANIDNIRIETNGMPVKDAYTRFNRAFGDELFPTNLKQYEMAERIAEVVGNYRSIYENPYNMYIDLATQFAANDIMNSVFATPDSFAFDNANLDSVYDTINNRRGKLVEAIGTAYEKGEDINITTTDEYRKAQTIETETDDGVDYRKANLEPREWKTEKSKGNTAKAKNLIDIINQMEHDFGFNITEGQIRKKNVLGTYNRHNKGIRIKFDNDLPSATHELGHALDRRYGVSEKMSDALFNELMDNHDAIAVAQIKSHKNPATHKTEAIAEYLRVLMLNKSDALHRFPKFSEYFLNSMDEDDRAHVLSIADTINAYYVEAERSAATSIQQRSEGLEDHRTFKQRMITAKERFIQDWVDSNYGIKKFDKAAGSKAYILATNAAYADARAWAIMTGDMFDSHGNPVGEGFKSALEGVNIDNDKEYMDFGEYLVCKHGPEFMETTNGNVFANPLQNNAKWMNDRAAELEEKYPAFKDAAKRLYEFQDNLLLVYGVETGLVDREMYDEWKKRWNFYVPFNRVIVNNGKRGFNTVSNSAGNNFANQGNLITKAHGSTKTLIHPLENIENNIVRFVKAGLNNQVMATLTAAAERNNVDANFIEKVPMPLTQDKFYTEALKKSLSRQTEQSFKDGNIDATGYDAMMALIDNIDDVLVQYHEGQAHGDVVTVMKKGKAEYWKINDPLLFESLAGLKPKHIKGVVAAYGVVTKMMTSNITGKNFVWAISRNAPKDIGTAVQYMHTKSPAALFGGIAKAYINSGLNAVGAETDPYYQEYLAMGGGKTSVYSADMNLGEKVREGITHKGLSWRTPFEAVGFISDTIELGPRYACYVAMRNRGMSPQEAFFEACDVTVNFRKGGALAREVNKLIPFFNANVQGIDKFFRYFTADYIPAEQKAKTIATRASFFIASSAIMAAITAALNYRDDKEKKEYMQLSSFTKNNYWLVPLSKFGGKSGQYFALPKSRELGTMSSFLERLFEMEIGDNPHAFDEFATYITENLLPAGPSELADMVLDDDVDFVEAVRKFSGNLGIIGTGVYLSSNKDFLGRNIVKESLMDYEKKDQFTGSTSKFAYLIGQQFNLSPQRIDFVGEQVFSFAWKPLKALFPKDEFYRDKTLGIKNSWIKDNQYSNDIVNWLYDHKEDSMKAHNSDKTSGEKSYRYSMDTKMASFYSTFYNLQKERDETDESRKYRQMVIDMVYDYQKSVENGIPTSQKAVYDVVAKSNNTELLPTELKSTVKDVNDKKFELDYKQFFDYQTRYNNYYYNMANEVLGVLKDTAERETALGDIKKIAQYKATDDILSAFGTTGGNLTRYNDIDPVQIVFYNIYKDRADAAGVSVDEKTGVAKSNGTIDQTEATYAINQMDWLTPHEKAVLWQSTNSSWKVKNNPWGAYL